MIRKKISNFPSGSYTPFPVFVEVLFGCLPFYYVLLCLIFCSMELDCCKVVLYFLLYGDIFLRGVGMPE